MAARLFLNDESAKGRILTNGIWQHGIIGEARWELAEVVDCQKPK
jgi:hypothetical protein